MNLQLLRIDWLSSGVRVHVRDVDGDVDVKPVDVDPKSADWKGKITPQFQQAAATVRQTLLQLVGDYLASDTPARAAAAALEQKAEAEAARDAAEQTRSAAEATLAQKNVEIAEAEARLATLLAEIANAEQRAPAPAEPQA